MYAFWNGAGVRSCYDEGKRTAETLSMDYHRGLNLEVPLLVKQNYFCFEKEIMTRNFRNILLWQVRIARIFNTYGPRMCLDDGRVVSNFVAQVCFYTCFETSTKSYSSVINILIFAL